MPGYDEVGTVTPDLFDQLRARDRHPMGYVWRDGSRHTRLPLTAKRRLWGRGRWSLWFEPRDLWVGAYWTHERIQPVPLDGRASSTWPRRLVVYVCLVPCLPLRWVR